MAALGPDPQLAIEQVTRSLLERGHRRIVMLIRRQHRQPIMGVVPKTFLATLEAHGIQQSPYVLPDWEETVSGFQNCLTQLFQVTPPTALLVDEPELFAATYHFLSARGLRVPQDVSLIFLGHEPVFDWCVPTVARIEKDFSKLIPHILRWADNVSRGKRDLRQHALLAKYVPGGTVASPPGR
jgi:DNA-binding LacI/PurR family transcriptional regulator